MQLQPNKKIKETAYSIRSFKTSPLKNLQCPVSQRVRDASCFLSCTASQHPSERNRNREIHSLKIHFFKYNCKLSRFNATQNLIYKPNEPFFYVKIRTLLFLLTWKIVPSFFSPVARARRTSLETLGSLSTCEKERDKINNRTNQLIIQCMMNLNQYLTDWQTRDRVDSMSRTLICQRD